MIKSAIKSEARILAELAIQLWNNHTVLELEEMFENLIQSDKAICFIKYVDNIAVGFAQCQIRTDYVEGTEICQSIDDAQLGTKSNPFLRFGW